MDSPFHRKMAERNSSYVPSARSRRLVEDPVLYFHPYVADPLDYKFRNDLRTRHLWTDLAVHEPHRRHSGHLVLSPSRSVDPRSPGLFRRNRFLERRTHLDYFFHYLFRLFFTSKVYLHSSLVSSIVN